MGDNRKTDVMNKDGSVTAIMNDASRQTELMNTDGRATAIMANDSAAIDFSRKTSIDKYKIKKVIAENTGEASLLLTESDGNAQVIKLYHQNTKPDERIEKVLSQIDSPYIMPHTEGGIADNRVYEVLPYFQKGDLSKLLPLDADFISTVVVKSINEGLKVLHDNGIIHRDIKPSNLFLSDDSKNIVLGDFGISSLLDKNVSVRATSMSRTFGYSAPEASSGFVSKESDYYSFGITLLHLVMGQDPFLGMTDMQILYQTINKPIEIPSTVNPRLQQLIRGLTLKDRNNRWGYEEVSRWLNNEDVEVKERKTYKDIKPYTFQYNKYYGLEEISMAFANDWENAKRHLFRGLVEKNVAQYGEEYAVNIMELKELSDQDAAVFKMIYILNPHAPLCYKGEVYTDLQALGMKMYEFRPHGNSFSPTYLDIMNLIESGCLTEYIEKNNYDDNLKKQVLFDVQCIGSGKADYYYALMYLLYPEIGFDFDNKKYVNLEDFVNDLENKNSTQISKICQSLVSNKLFLMWIHSLGYSEQINKWMEIYEKAVW